MKTQLILTSALVAYLGFGSTAYAHMGVRGTAVAGQSFVATFTIPHGCTADDNGTTIHSDTEVVTIALPSDITAFRPMHGGVFGEPSIETRNGQNVIVYTRTANARTTDDLYYEISIRMTAFSAAGASDTLVRQLAFTTRQDCFGGGFRDWTGADSPTLRVFPRRAPGWNHYSLPDGHYEPADLQRWFGDALILWSGNRAWSPNPETRALITSDPDANPIEAVHSEAAAPAEIWVRY